MPEAIIYPGINNEYLESLKGTLERRGIEYSISPTGSSGEYRSTVSIGGDLYHNSATLLKRLDSLQPKT